MTKAVYGNNWYIASFAIASQNVIHSRIIDIGLYEDWLILRKPLYQFRKLNNRLPVNLNFANRRFVLLDKDGQILWSRAKQPSDPELKKDLDQLFD